MPSAAVAPCSLGQAGARQRRTTTPQLPLPRRAQTRCRARRRQRAPPAAARVALRRKRTGVSSAAMMAPLASFFCVVAAALTGSVYGGTATPASGSVMDGIVGAEPPKRPRKPELLGAALSAGSARAAALVCSALAP